MEDREEVTAPSLLGDVGFADGALVVEPFFSGATLATPYREEPNTRTRVSLEKLIRSSAVPHVRLLTAHGIGYRFLGFLDSQPETVFFLSQLMAATIVN